MPRPALAMATDGRLGVDVVAETCAALGVRLAFVSPGDRCTGVRDALAAGGVRSLAVGEQASAVYAAVEASVASGRPVVVLGDGGRRSRALVTALSEAETSGAKVLLVSVRWEDDSPGAERAVPLPGSAVLTFPVDAVSDLAPVAARLQRGLIGRDTFLAHLDVAGPVARDGAGPAPLPPWRLLAPAPKPAAVDEVASMLISSRVAIWVGRAARDAAPQVRALVLRTGCAVFATPGGKGVVPEDDARYLGVSSQVGHRTLPGSLAFYGPDRLLVLGTEVGEIEPSDEALIPAGGIVHVHPDPSVHAPFVGGAPVLAVEADVARFLDAVLERAVQPTPGSPLGPCRPFPADPSAVPTPPCWVRPEILMSTIQRVVVDGSDARLFVDGGAATALATQRLRFRHPGRLRILGRHAPAGQLVAGAVGAAGSGDRVVCLTENGARLLPGPAAVAVEHGMPVSWVLLDGGGPGSSPVDPVDLGRACGVTAVRVEREAFLADALRQSVAGEGPSVVGVVIDRSASRTARRRPTRAIPAA